MFTPVSRAALLSLLLATPAWAQQTPDSAVSPALESARAEDTVGEEIPSTDATGDADADAQVETEDEELDGATADKSPSAIPPGDYRPSEQISEDLSVSFPVDI